MAESHKNFAVPPGYVLLEKIGSSKTGAIFKAQKGKHGQLVAIKFLTRTAASVGVLTFRFQRTIRILSTLQHPTLIRALEAGQQDDAQYLVMEYVDGKDLRTILKERGPLPIAEALNYTSQAAAGLACLHDHGICHRNIKPGNLLADTEGKLKIIGLGLAHVLDGRSLGEDSPEDILTPKGEIVGTYEYMAPEQAIDSNQIDARADIFSLGCTLHTLLTGRPPEVLQSPEQPFGNSIPSLALVRPDAPPALDRILQKMLARHVDGRYPSMNVVWAELSSVIVKPPEMGLARDMPLPRLPFPPAMPSAFTQPSPTASPLPVTPPPAPGQAQLPLETAPDSGPPNGIEDLIGSYQTPIKKKPVSVKRKAKPASTTAYFLPILICLISGLIVGIGAAIYYKQQPELAHSNPSSAPAASSSISMTKPAETRPKPRKSIAEEIAETQQREKEELARKAANAPSEKKTTEPQPKKTETPAPDQDATKKADQEPPPEKIARRPVPMQAECEKATKNILIIYQGDIEAAKSPDDKSALARKLIGSVADPNLSPVDRYATLMQAIDFAKSGNDLEAALDAVATINKDFEVDEWKAKLDLVAAMCDGKLSRTKPETLVEAVLTLQARAMEQHLIAIADQLSDYAAKACKTSKDRDLRGRVQSAKNRSATCLKLQADYNAAQETLKSQPQDADANLMAGKYECFILEKWDAGLPKLKIALPETDGNLVNKDIKQPSDPTEQAELGDGWCEFAKKLEKTKEKLFQPGIYRRALWWYDKAQEHASGLLKTRVQSAIDKIPVDKKT